MEKKLTEKEIEILVHNKNVYNKLNANFFKQFKQNVKNKKWLTNL